MSQYACEAAMYNISQWTDRNAIDYEARKQKLKLFSYNFFYTFYDGNIFISTENESLHYLNLKCWKWREWNNQEFKIQKIYLLKVIKSYYINKWIIT